MHFVLAIVLLLICSSCVANLPSEVTVTFAPSAVLEDPLASRYIKDYEYLWSILENEYPFFHIAETITQKNFAEVKGLYSRKIESVTNDYDFFNKIVYPCLSEFQYIGHLSAVTKKEYEQEYNTLNVLMDDGELQPYALSNFEQYNLPLVRMFYKGKVSPFKLSNIDKMVMLERSIPEKSNLNFNFFQSLSTAYFSISSMTMPFENNDEKTLEEFFRIIENEGYKNCIIDLRGNGGGSDRYWQYNIVLPNLKNAISINYYSLLKGDISTAYVKENGIPIYPIKNFPANLFSNFNINDIQYFDQYSISNFTIDRYGEEPYPILFSGQFWVLIDSGVYSAADSFVQFCNNTEFAKTVGTASSGGGYGLAPMILSLPETGICIRFSTMNTLNIDGSYNEEVGTVPDFLIKQEDDALAACLNIIRNS